MDFQSTIFDATTEAASATSTSAGTFKQGVSACISDIVYLVVTSHFGTLVDIGSL